MSLSTFLNDIISIVSLLINFEIIQWFWYLCIAFGVLGLIVYFIDSFMDYQMFKR